MSFSARNTLILGTIVGTLGEIDTASAPVLRFRLTLAIETGAGASPVGALSGKASIGRPIVGAADDIAISDLVGSVYDQGAVGSIVVLRGGFRGSAGAIEPFEAVMLVDDDWKGRGGFAYGRAVVDVPVDAVETPG